MLSALPRLWSVDEEVVGRILEIHKIEVLFQSEDSMFSILRRGPWSFNDWMCVIQRWTKLHSDAEFKRIPFWIQIRGIPLRFLTARIITSIGERMGLFLETNLGRDGVVLTDYVMVKILCNIDDPLRFQRIFRFGEKSVF